MIFFHLTISPRGDIQRTRQFETELLVRKRVTLCARVLAQNGDEFRATLGELSTMDMELHWHSRTSGAATAFLKRDRAVLCSFALAAGHSCQQDDHVMRWLQRELVSAIDDGRIEPSYDLLTIRQRPVLFSVPWPKRALSTRERLLVDDFATCLAAAFFETA